MARYKDANWNLTAPNVQTWDQAQVAVLMDLRDELKKLNAVLACPNFQEIPHTLKAIRAKLPSRNERLGRLKP